MNVCAWLASLHACLFHFLTQFLSDHNGIESVAEGIQSANPDSNTTVMSFEVDDIDSQRIKATLLIASNPFLTLNW